jgi:hypothetical protein
LEAEVVDLAPATGVRRCKAWIRGGVDECPILDERDLD